MDSATAQAKSLYTLCSKNKWKVLMDMIRQNPSLTMSQIIAVNGQKTTIMHQAILGGGDVQDWVELIKLILKEMPEAAEVESNTSLPLHMLLQGHSIPAKKRTPNWIDHEIWAKGTYPPSCSCH
jgi:hypothetical protein